MVLCAQRQPSPGGNDDPLIAVAGEYVNQKYGFAIRIPEAVKAYRPGAPAPQHGVELRVTDAPGGYVWANAEFDALGLGTAGDLAEHEAGSLALKYHLRLVATVATNLGGLEAREVTLENVQASGDVNYLRFVIAFRPVPNEIGVVYVVGLRQRIKTTTAAEVFESVVKSFRTEMLR